MRERDIYSLSIVLIGNFNPVIISPFWLASKGLIREIEAETARVDVIHSEVTKFELDWFSFESTQARIDFKTNRESHFNILRDLIISIFELLKETPISAIGINHLCHYSLKTFEEYRNFGYWFSPVKEFSEVMHEPKMLSVQYVESNSDDNGSLKLSITPSDLIPDNKSVLINCNHHFQITKKDAKGMLAVLINNWDDSFMKTDKLIDLLWSKVTL